MTDDDGPVRFIAWGTPVPKGSLVAVPRKDGGRPFVRPVNAWPLAKWTRAVSTAAAEAMRGRESFDGPLRVLLLITIGDRPKSRHDLYPATKNRDDIDKHARSILDALKPSAIVDDGLIVDHQTLLRWCNLAGGLPEPGARVTVQRMPVEALVQ